MQVNSFLRDHAISGSGTDVPAACGALKADSTLPACADREMTANWEDFFLVYLHPPLRIHHTTVDTDEDIIEVNAAQESKEP